MGIPAPFGVSAAGLPPAGDQANAVVTGTIASVRPHRPFAMRGPMNVALWASYNSALTTTAKSLTATVAAAGVIAAGNAINSANVPKGTTVGAIAATTITLALPTYTYYASGLNLNSPNQLTLPPGSNVTQLVGATVAAASTKSGITVPASTTVTAVVQADVAPSGNSPGTPGIIQLSAALTAVPQDGAGPLQFALGAEAITASSADTAAIFTGVSIVYSATLQLEKTYDGGSTWLLCNIGGGGQLAVYSAGTPVSLTFGEPERQVLYRVNCTVYASVTGTTVNYRISETGGAAESLAIGALI